jgi:putative transposase
VERICLVLLVSERRACRALSFPRSSHRYARKRADSEDRLVARIVELAKDYGRYGYRRITALLSGEGWFVNHKRVERIWRQEGLKVPQKQPKRGRLWLADGSCVRLRPERARHVWSYDFVADRTRGGRSFRILNIIDEYTRECLASMAERKFTASDVIGALAELFLKHGLPEHIRSDNGPEFTAKSVRRWLEKLGARTLFIEPGSPWENGYIESFNGKMRDELLNGEIFDTLIEAKVLIERWRVHYNKVRPHSSLRYRPPAPEAVLTNPLEMPLILPEKVPVTT